MKIVRSKAKLIIVNGVSAAMLAMALSAVGADRECDSKVETGCGNSYACKSITVENQIYYQECRKVTVSVSSPLYDNQKDSVKSSGQCGDFYNGGPNCPNAVNLKCGDKAKRDDVTCTTPTPPGE